jgi:FKBP-type peptidyl-prolyl cis-trans isomerase
MKIKNLIPLFFAFVIILSSCDKSLTSKVKLETELDTLSYALGVNITRSLQQAQLEELNYDIFLKGMNDAFEKNDIQMDEEKIIPFIKGYFTKLRTLKLQKNLEEGIAFLAENKQKEGIITTESGLQYEILKEGTGKSPSSRTDTVVCHYHGTLIDGTVFDSSVEKGEPFKTALNRVIPGWTEGIMLMKEGAKYKFYLPTNLGYGSHVRPGGIIEANMALIFEVELIEVIEGSGEIEKDTPFN